MPKSQRVFFLITRQLEKIRDQKCSSSIAAESLFSAMASPQLELAFCEDFASGKLHDPYTNRPPIHEKEPHHEDHVVLKLDIRWSSVVTLFGRVWRTSRVTFEDYFQW